MSSKAAENIGVREVSEHEQKTRPKFDRKAAMRGGKPLLAQPAIDSAEYA